MGNSAGSRSILWTKVLDLLPGYGPQRWIWFRSMGHNVIFGFALWATAQVRVPNEVVSDQMQRPGGGGVREAYHRLETRRGAAGGVRLRKGVSFELEYLD
jgi:hypothetical protein